MKLCYHALRLEKREPVSLPEQTPTFSELIQEVRQLVQADPPNQTCDQPMLTVFSFYIVINFTQN
jgi:hypothetical protein